MNTDNLHMYNWEDMNYKTRRAYLYNSNASKLVCYSILLMEVYLY